MNARNQHYIRPENFRSAIRLADSKLALKLKLDSEGLPLSKTLAVIKTRQELFNFDWSQLPDTFVVKPNRGFGGEGILIAYGRRKDGDWVKTNSEIISQQNLAKHIQNILDGNFSLSHVPDIAMFEERIEPYKRLKPYCYKGIADIRVIVYHKVPVMAMLRLPTKESGGRANLHLGGVGVGIDIATGITTHAICHNRLINFLPDSRLVLRGLKTPHWKSILKLAGQAQDVSGLGFAGIDIALDKEKGPIILEVNARPGLSIQIANLSPLGQRLQRVKGLKIKSVKRGIRIAQDLWGGEVEEEIEDVSGKKMIGVSEIVAVLDSRGNKHQVMAKIDTGANRTSICRTLVKKLCLDTKEIDQKKVRSASGQEERPIIPLSFIMDEQLIETEAFISDREEMKYDLIIGRRDLKRYLIDPSSYIAQRERIQREEIKARLKEE